MAEVKQNQVEQAGATDRVYRIAELYKTSVAPALMAKFGYKNVNEVPKMVKIVLNMGLGDVKDNQIDAFGDAYEYLMTMYASNAGKSGGEFFTPADVSELLTRLGTVGKT